MRRALFTTMVLLIMVLAACDSGITLSSSASKETVGLPGGPVTSTIVPGEVVSSLSSANFSGYVKMGDCGSTSGGVSKSTNFQMSNPLLEAITP